MAEVSYYLCRLCAFKCLMPGIMVFSAEGLLNDIPRKIHECLHLMVQFGFVYYGDAVIQLFTVDSLSIRRFPKMTNFQK